MESCIPKGIQNQSQLIIWGHPVRFVEIRGRFFKIEILINLESAKIDEQFEESTSVKLEGYPPYFLREARRDVRKGLSSEFAKI